MSALSAPPQVPELKVDVAASEVHLTGSTDAETVRGLGATALDSMVATRIGAAVPARFVANIRGDFAPRLSTWSGAGQPKDIAVAWGLE